MPPRTTRPQDTKQPRCETTQAGPTGPRACYNCGKPGHFAMKCPQARQESKGRTTPSARTKQVRSRTRSHRRSDPTEELEPEEFLRSSSNEDPPAQVNSVRITDKGSVTQCVKVRVQGVPVYGLIDSGADITILGGSLFKKVATVARLKKRNFMKADKVPRTYDH